MKQRGFTLIELIGMVLILALVFLVSYPNFVSMSKKEEDNKKKILEKNLCLAGESYIYANPDSFDLNSSIPPINIGVLIDNGYVDENNIDSECQKDSNNNTICENSLEFTVKSDNSLECKYEES